MREYLGVLDVGYRYNKAWRFDDPVWLPNSPHDLHYCTTYTIPNASYSLFHDIYSRNEQDSGNESNQRNVLSIHIRGSEYTEHGKNDHMSSRDT
jgi:hypothetical protein